MVELAWYRYHVQYIVVVLCHELLFGKHPYEYSTFLSFTACIARPSSPTRSPLVKLSP